jgi:hypothetical protein
MNSWIVFKLFLFICIAFVFLTFVMVLLKKRFSDLNLKKAFYKRQDYLLSKAEKSFYDVLRLALNGKPFIIFVKVRLLDVIHPADKNITALNKVKSKHLDFLICDKNYISPVLAIELDDSSHVMLSRVERDNFLETALASARLPLLRFPVKRVYEINEIKEKMVEFLK